ncbi:MAG: mannose-1-phosphate guanylyltransferase/mannose-6-phosphate isomerase [Alistipes senegalensis]|nr:mannose-1-phosphate guanylyltransferase/mannose-6-phosphate isomerase [Oxalobacter formigenes]MCM1281587.1 mannose-1-phosphate guanylyltransferase/mannose-6-phosphate isomerase [Alistipes senegalensis]
MLIPVILSGGAGTRLWPVSREGQPKPFMKLADGETLLAKTYRRAFDVTNAINAGSGILNDMSLLTVTNRDYYFMSKDELARAGLGEFQHSVFLLEPEGRNTAPAIALAAHYIEEKYGRDALLLVLAADHLIQDTTGFTAAVNNAAVLAQQGKLVTFGIIPMAPETGFGYIEAGEALNNGRRVVRFVEKPSLEKAKEYLEAGNFFWNSGMFCFKAGVILDELACCAKDVAIKTETCWAALRDSTGSTETMLSIPEEAFRQVPDISIDYAIMEHSGNVVVVPADFGWSDIGSWNAVCELVKPDADNNRAEGEALFIDSHNVFVRSENRLVAAVGVDNLMVVDTPDALLVVHPDKAQDVKQVVSRLKKQALDVYKLHRTVTRPWGTYTILLSLFWV